MMEQKSVKVKGVGDSLWVTVGAGPGIEKLEAELLGHFERMRQLADGARVVIDAGEREDSQVVFEHFSFLLGKCFNVGEVARPPAVKKEAFHRVRSRESSHEWNNRNSDVLMMTGRVRSGQKVTAKKHLLLMGDVNPGAEVSAGGDIIVMGRLHGAALAGQPEKGDSIITALDFKPSRIQIGSLLTVDEKEGPARTPAIARVVDGQIVVEDYLKANPFGRIPWPEVR